MKAGMATAIAADRALDLFAESVVAKVAGPEPAELFPRRTVEVTGWVKTYAGPAPPQGKPAPLPVLNRVAGDGHEYREAIFALGPGVTVGVYALSGCRGVRVPGEKELISLYDAVRRDLARERQTEVPVK